MIHATAIGKRFGSVVAVRGVDLDVGPGEIVGLVGENGAGKTTTLRMLAGFVEPDSGTIEIAGCQYGGRDDPRRHLGYVPESAPLYGDMRVVEYLGFRARLKKVSRAKVDDVVEGAMRRTDVSDRSRWLISRLSRGWRQRVALADAFLGNPDVLLLDEPTASLDPMQVRHFHGALREYRNGRAILVASHVLSALETFVDRLVVVSKGQVAASGTADELRAHAGVPNGASLDDAFAAIVGGAEA